MADPEVQRLRGELRVARGEASDAKRRVAVLEAEGREEALVAA